MKINKLFVLNNGYDYVFQVGTKTIAYEEAKVKKIIKNERKDNAYIVFFEDGVELDIISDKIMILSK